MTQTQKSLTDLIEADNCRITILSATTQLQFDQRDFHGAEWTQALSIKSPHRRDEFLRTRWLLHHLIGTEYDFSRGAHGFVNWPEHWLGSISHSQGHVAVALTNNGKDLGLGLDLECLKRVRPELNKKICRPGEWERITAAHHDQHESQLIGRIFAAKEALYKAVYPSGLKQFWFEDAEMITLSDQLDQGEIRILTDAAPNAKHGKIFEVQFFNKMIGDDEFIAALCRFRDDSTESG